ncbi:MAG: hypothetical protein ACOCQ4_03405 [bacterium]
MYKARIDWKKLLAVLLLVVASIAYESVLGNQRESGDIRLKNLYMNESIGFNNNRAIVEINLNNYGKLENNYYLVVRASEKIGITSNLKDCTQNYQTFDYRIDDGLGKKDRVFENYKIFYLDGNHPVVGLRTGQEYDGKIGFIIYQSKDKHLTPDSEKVFEKNIDFGK